MYTIYINWSALLCWKYWNDAQISLAWELKKVKKREKEKESNKSPHCTVSNVILERVSFNNTVRFHFELFPPMMDLSCLFSWHAQISLDCAELNPWIEAEQRGCFRKRSSCGQRMELNCAACSSSYCWAHRKWEKWILNLPLGSVVEKFTPFGWDHTRFSRYLCPPSCCCYCHTWTILQL